MAARTAADGEWVQRTARTAADGVGARGWLEMGGEKKPLVMSDLGCADGCGRQMGAENCVDGCGRRGCNGVAGNGWGEEAAGDERPWLRGRLRTANGCGELLRTACVQRRGCKGVAEKMPLVMSDLGCADGCGRQMGGENCDGCGRRGCNGVAGNGWGEEAAGDERPWLRGRLRTANGCGELRRMAADSVGATEWLEMGGEKKPLVMSDLGSGELRGWLRKAWVQRSGWKWKGQEGKGRERMGKEGTDRKGKEGKGRERKGREGKGREREGKGRERMGKEGKGRERMGKERKRMGKEGKGMERTAADGLTSASVNHGS